ncbi:hypothetical protein [Pseudonocardia sp. TMWB2A]|uniref:hypothetical protein n=1 Tax=Pseudonocardia sp. TMWB2A TaxID=687430 RepID=UPI00307D12F3
MIAVPADYRHKQKCAQPRTVLEASRARVKCYALYADDARILPEIEAQARAYLESHALPAVAEADDLGFAVLHKCGADFHFLLLQLWRGANEIWEAVYYTDKGMDGFAPFAPANPGPPAALRPTLCVWETGIVAFEARAWNDFLVSLRDDAAEQAYLSHMFQGDV